MTIINCHLAIRHNIESTSGIKAGCGLLYRPTSANTVTRRLPPFGFLTRNEGLMYSATIQYPQDD